MTSPSPPTLARSHPGEYFALPRRLFCQARGVCIIWPKSTSVHQNDQQINRNSGQEQSRRIFCLARVVCIIWLALTSVGRNDQLLDQLITPNSGQEQSERLLFPARGKCIVWLDLARRCWSPAYDISAPCKPSPTLGNFLALGTE